jgi:hypothetical protein
MSWLLRDGDVLAAIDAPRKGWRHAVTGAVVLPSPVVFQTFVDPVSMDVAWCSKTSSESNGKDSPALIVKRIRSVGPHRLAAPLLGPGALVAAPIGSFERWRLQVGDRLEIREA